MPAPATRRRRTVRDSAPLATPCRDAAVRAPRDVLYGATRYTWRLYAYVYTPLCRMPTAHAKAAAISFRDIIFFSRFHCRFDFHTPIIFR
jgi:hypothetical protein